MIYDIEVQQAFQRIGHWKKYFEESERNQSQDIVNSGSEFDFDSDSDSDLGWEKVKKAQRRAKTSEIASFYVFCTSSVGKGLADQQNTGDASGPPKAGGTRGTPNSSIPESDSGDRAIGPDPLDPSSLVNQLLDLPWASLETFLKPDESKPWVPLYERESTLFKKPRREEPSHHEPMVIII